MSQSSSPSTSTSTPPFSLPSLLNKTLRIHTTDSRMFLGQFKCVDSDANTILAQTYEYTPPPAPKNIRLNPGETVKTDMSSRYVGLVVVPGEYIRKIEVEEFESQVRGRERARAKEEGKGGSG